MTEAAQTVPARPAINFGRSAIIIQGLAVLIAIPLGIWFAQTEALGVKQIPIAAVGTSTIVILVTWSLVLSIRSLLNQGLRAGACIVGAVALIEIGALFFVPLLITIPDELEEQWTPWMDAYVGTAIPLVVPLLCVVALLAAPIAWAWSRIARRRFERSVTGKPRRGTISGVRLFADIFGLITVLALPWVLFVYCVQYREGWREDLLPRFPRFTSGVILDAIGYRNSDWLDEFRRGMLEHAPISGKKVEAIVRATERDPEMNVVWDEALARWATEYPEFGCEYIREIGLGKRQELPHPNPFHGFAWILGRRGSPQVIREFLFPKAEISEQFRLNVISGVQRNIALNELVPDLERIANAQEIASPDAAKAIAQFCTPEQNATRFAKLICSNDKEVAASAGRCLWNIPVIYKGSLNVVDCFDRLDRRGRLRIFSQTAGVVHRGNDSLALQWVAHLIKLLDDPDIAIRRGAVHGLSWTVRQYFPKCPRPQAGVSGGSTIDGADPLPEIPSEREEVDLVRAAAKDWFESQRMR